MSAWIKQHGAALLVQLLGSVIVGAFAGAVAVQVLSVRIQYAEQGVQEAKACCQAAQTRMDNFLLRGGG